MNRDLALLAAGGKKKCGAAIVLVEASLRRVQPYDSSRNYTPDELEPYDALADRFVRVVEIALRFFRTIEMLHEAVASDTLRDRLHRMEKIGLISETPLWLDMRDVRNRIVHDYLPEQVAEMFAQITGPFAAELARFRIELAGIDLSSS